MKVLGYHRFITLIRIVIFDGKMIEISCCNCYMYFTHSKWFLSDFLSATSFLLLSLLSMASVAPYFLLLIRLIGKYLAESCTVLEFTLSNVINLLCIYTHKGESKCVYHLIFQKEILWSTILYETALFCVYLFCSMSFCTDYLDSCRFGFY